MNWSWRGRAATRVGDKAMAETEQTEPPWPASTATEVRLSTNQPRRKTERGSRLGSGTWTHLVEPAKPVRVPLRRRLTSTATPSGEHQECFEINGGYEIHIGPADEDTCQSEREKYAEVNTDMMRTQPDTEIVRTNKFPFVVIMPDASLVAFWSA